MKSRLSVIIVTHNSQDYIQKAIENLHNQSMPIDKVYIVDSGSEDRAYLIELNKKYKIEVTYERNIGFSKANNLGFKNVHKDSDFVLFLNPDTYLREDFVEKALKVMHEDEAIGVVSGRILGFDVKSNCASGLIDSTGIFRKIYGRWYDRGNGVSDEGQYVITEEVPALCGALLFCRRKALDSLGENVFDPDFFMYKEDIEFSLRIRKYGWKLIYDPQLIAYHCRGWQRRSEISYDLKKTAAKSEILLYKKHPSPYIFWAYLKYWVVVTLRI